MKKKILYILLALIIGVSAISISGCDYGGSQQDISDKLDVDAANTLRENQPTPTDIEYSLERYNLIRRVYWVNGQREKANTLPCEIEKPLGYIVLFTGNTVVGNFVVDGKVSSLNSFLTPDSKQEDISSYVKWLSDAGGLYGENNNGIFFFTSDGKYIEWTGTYLYSDIPFEVESPVLNIAGGN